MADAHTFAEAYDLILGGQHVAKTGALRVTTADGTPRYSFNIASIGLDAYIAGLTNRFKRVIPGDAYKSLVDIGSLFYEQKVKPLPMDIGIHARRRGRPASIRWFPPWSSWESAAPGRTAATCRCCPGRTTSASWAG